ncbi:heterokaryon incompatibility protein-domain-containing protein [Leptodontidium sp. MPI-SDFR-AT-0119]|nr:heterokaryon incompatibility protein-domain-containing protein [Leptodontidium sp. MPI-SDFR-AT-0119]
MTLNQDHGRQKHSKALTRRARLHSKKGAFPDAVVVLLRNLCLETRSPTFLGRAVGKQYINLDLLRGWIDTCVSCHGLACETLHDAELASNSLYVDGMRFIDVIKMRLATAWVKSIKYVALSYVWGSAEMARTVMGKYQSAALYGGFAAIYDTLPRTIQDSIHLAKSLGFRYLWVDSLCIQQDDEQDKKRLIGLMDKIYGSSVLTICVASGDHANAGLPGICQPRELFQDLGRCAGMDLLIVRLVEDRITDSTWNTRAWTFQERLLSNRCLVFADDRVFFLVVDPDLGCSAINS